MQRQSCWGHLCCPSSVAVSAADVHLGLSEGLRGLPALQFVKSWFSQANQVPTYATLQVVKNICCLLSTMPKQGGGVQHHVDLHTKRLKTSLLRNPGAPNSPGQVLFLY